MSAALYLLRDGKKVLILEKETIGGSIASTPLIENYPGVKAVSGSELTDIIQNLTMIKVPPSMVIKNIVVNAAIYEIVLGLYV